jgi:hypothetical protein
MLKGLFTPKDDAATLKHLAFAAMGVKAIAQRQGGKAFLLFAAKKASPFVAMYLLARATEVLREMEMKHDIVEA